MGSYVPNTPEERQEMLRAIGLHDFRELYGDVPASMYLDRPLDLPSGMSELEVRRTMTELAGENKVFSTILRGAGAYDHYIPSIVKYIPAKEEFLTAYTPYQAEMSQGILQSIFEYQTMICELTGMDVSNASVYDGATAAAEAAAMCRDRKRRVTLISGAAHPDVIRHCPYLLLRHGRRAARHPRQGRKDRSGRPARASDGRGRLRRVHRSSRTSSASSRMPRPSVRSSMQRARCIILSCNPIALGILKTPKRVRRGYRSRRGTAARYAPRLGRPVSRLHGRYVEARCVSCRAVSLARPVDSHGERCLCPVAAGARAAHPPREGQQQHLLERGAVRADGRRLSLRHGSGGPCRGWRARAWPRRTILPAALRPLRA